jgi:hypothetical protein
MIRIKKIETYRLVLYIDYRTLIWSVQICTTNLSVLYVLFSFKISCFFFSLVVMMLNSSRQLFKNKI